MEIRTPPPPPTPPPTASFSDPLAESFSDRWEKNFRPRLLPNVILNMNAGRMRKGASIFKQPQPSLGGPKKIVCFDALGVGVPCYLGDTFSYTNMKSGRRHKEALFLQASDAESNSCAGITRASLKSPSFRVLKKDWRRKLHLSYT